jgi:hypothetical protein
VSRQAAQRSGDPHLILLAGAGPLHREDAGPFEGETPLRNVVGFAVGQGGIERIHRAEGPALTFKSP